MKTNLDKPLIGITCVTLSQSNWVPDTPGLYMDAVFRDYFRAVEFAGGIPVLIPIFKHMATARRMLRRIDGLLLTGGHDVSPRLFGEEPIVGIQKMDYERDVMEIEVVREADRLGIPLLGICRGIQTINVAFGGTLYQDLLRQAPGSLDHHQKAPKHVPTHRARIEKGSRLFDIVQTESLWINSHHHQAVKDPAPGFNVVAKSGDGIIEAIEKPDKTFLMGIQWHAEGTWEKDDASQKIFKALVGAAVTED